uniref:25S rRNA (uridine-N(3))-methyltransferase-like isoform X2 n=1 Tax=Erigeron canadensis TaxID=72917 RepID=UPI001CB98E0E|nr:25S rRNA (uridine-N(3))-methyltransferase-like isoform X2 [Erigeron canadensis]
MSLREEEKSGSSCPNQPNSKKRSSGNSQKKVVKCLKHYSSNHRILLVGEGDFSFSLSLGMAFGDASNIVATSLDSYDVVIKKYKEAKTNLENLHSLGAQLLHEVDALQMKLHRDLQMQKFDWIIYNFPHAGFFGPEDDQKVIKKHRNLVSGFYKNASGMLCPKGEVHVTHKTSDPFQSWNIEELATQNSLTLLERIKFKLKDYPGYSNKRGDGNRSDESFPLGECSTYKFVLFSKGSSKEDGLCNCKPPLKKVEHTSWSKKNPNRRFMGCPKYGGPESVHCKSVDWIDPPLSESRYKEAMYELHLIRRERDEKERLMKSLTHQRKEKEAEIEALVEEKIQNEKLMVALKSQNKEMLAYIEELMVSLTHQRNEKEAAIEALPEERIQKKKLMEALKSPNKETDAFEIWQNKLYKRCLMVSAVLVVGYWCCRSKKR